MHFCELRRRFFRVKTVSSDPLETRLQRCLTTTDITLLGIGHMIGAGIYVLTGSVVLHSAGPSIILSFALAGIASLLAALCYAEFGSRFPKAGSAYTYAYIGVGELWAFIIGWNVVLEHMLGAAAIARAWSGYLRSLFGKYVPYKPHLVEEGLTFGNIKHFFWESLDFVAFSVIVVVGVFVALGSRTSTNVNSFFTVINMMVILFVTLYGFTFADFSYWKGVNESGEWNFMPFGWSGMFTGAASCFFAYIGFDGLATAGEESQTPARSIPLATFASMSFVTIAYILMSAALTLMVPYYMVGLFGIMLSTFVNPTAAFSEAFAQHGAIWAKYIVSIGAISGMATSLVGSLFALPRCVYAMAEDGLLFSVFAKISEKTQVPVNAMVVFGTATAIIALLFTIDTLVQFLSIGTLLAYTFVSACVIILRYRPTIDADDIAQAPGGQVRSWVPFDKWLKLAKPSELINVCVFVLISASSSIGLTLATGAASTLLGITLLVVSTVVSFIALGLMCLHHQNNEKLQFKVPFVPFVPALSMFINILLMLHLAPITWLRLLVWLLIGKSQL
uniref:AA_permease_C domain-containing protein n=1 Tax=Syphacia muris TaxID=451379 RepID=A0A0N5AL44_9BILA